MHEIFLFRVSETRQQSCRLIKNFPRDKCLQAALRPIYISRGATLGLVCQGLKRNDWIHSALEDKSSVSIYKQEICSERQSSQKKEEEEEGGGGGRRGGALDPRTYV